METFELARRIASEAFDMKAKDLKILDLRGMVSYTDYFLLATGSSDRHLRSIADRVHMKMKKDLGRLPISYEGKDSGSWILLDYGDVVLHLFLEEQRKFYGLDEFWIHAPSLSADGSKLAKPPAKPKAKKPVLKKRPVRKSLGKRSAKRPTRSTKPKSKRSPKKKK